MSMAFDYKKEYREFYLPPRTPGLIDVPQTRYIAVSGSGDLNAPRRRVCARCCVFRSAACRDGDPAVNFAAGGLRGLLFAGASV